MPDPVNADRSTTAQTTNETRSRLSIGDSLVAPVSVRWVWVLGVAVVVGDLVTTVYGLDVGLRERNPFVVAVLARYGVAGLVGLKLVAIGWVAVIWRGLGRRYGVAAMAGLILPQSIAVGLNVVTILTA